MRAEGVLAALRRKHHGAAFVPEVVLPVRDHGAWERYYQALEDGSEDAQRPSEVRRIDALMFDGPQRTAVEIKVSRADAARDTWRKVAPWRDIVHRFIYAVPAGLLAANEVPVHGCGLWWVHDDGRVEVVRKASIQRHPEHLPQSVVTSLAYRAARVSRIH